MKLLLHLTIFGLAVMRLHANGLDDLKSMHKILIVGDSITHHSPAPEVGWTGDWGMAATAAGKDYVHLFLAQFAAAKPPKVPAPEVWIVADDGGKIADQLPFSAKLAAFKADLALVQLGENDDKDVSVQGFQQPYETLLAAIRAGNPKARILCAGVWGSEPDGDQTKNKLIRAACQKYGASFADLGAAYADPGNRAISENRYTNTAVNWHPGDGGMDAYAEAFWKALINSSAPVVPKPPGKPVEVVETWSTPPILKWSPVPPVTQEDGLNVAKISSPGPEGAVSWAPLDAHQFGGRQTTIRTRVRADAVSTGPNPWNGVKVTLRVRNAQGAVDYPQFKMPIGTFPWTEVNWTVRVPDDTIDLSIAIGLEEVSGTVWYDTIHVLTPD